MVEIISTVSNNQAVQLFIAVLEKIRDRVQENYSDILIVERRKLAEYEFDPMIYRRTKKTKKILFYTRKTEEIDVLVEIETNILDTARSINVTINDAFISPIAKEEITKFVGSHKELRVEKIVYVENFSAGPASNKDSE